MDKRQALRESILKAIVRTPEGAKRYGLPIGSVIEPDVAHASARRRMRRMRDIRLDQRGNIGAIDFYNSLIDRLRKNEGFTVDAVSGKDRKRGFSVAMRPVRPYTMKVDNIDQVTPEVVAHWMHDPGVSQMLARPEYRAGAWVDTDDPDLPVYFDVVQIIPDGPDALDKATALGTSNNQISVFHLTDFTEHKTGGTGEPYGRNLGPRSARYGEMGNLIKSQGLRLVLFRADDDPADIAQCIKGDPTKMMLRKAGREWVKPHYDAEGNYVRGYWRVGRRSYKQHAGKGGKRHLTIDVLTPSANGEEMRPLNSGEASMDGLTPDKQKTLRGWWAKAMVVKGKPVSYVQAQRNIVAVYHGASAQDRAEGVNWFQNSHDQLVAAAPSTLRPEQAVGIGAVLSAGKSWDQNIVQAQYLMQRLGADEPFSAESARVHDERAKRMYEKALADFNAGKRKEPPAKPQYLKRFVGKRPSEIITKKGGASIVAALVRADSFKDDLRTDPKESENGKANKVAWNTAVTMTKAVNIFYAQGGRMSVEDTLDHNIGGQKVRSFFNNLNDPQDDRDVTIDSHAFGIMLGLPVSNQDARYNDVFAGKGTDNSGVSGFYALGADVYRKALNQINGERAHEGQEPITLSQLQSIVWLAWRNQNKASERAAATRAGANTRKTPLRRRIRKALL